MLLCLFFHNGSYLSKTHWMTKFCPRYHFIDLITVYGKWTGIYMPPFYSKWPLKVLSAMIPFSAIHTNTLIRHFILSTLSNIHTLIWRAIYYPDSQPTLPLEPQTQLHRILCNSLDYDGISDWTVKA